MRASLLFLAACAPTLASMRPATSGDYRAAQDSALVVFVRPSAYATLTAQTVIDERGHLLGESAVKTSFAVKLAPGKHRFVIFTPAGDAHALDAELLAGRRYYVEMSASPLGQADLFAIAPRIAKWSEHEHWVENSDQLVCTGGLFQQSEARLREAARWYETLTPEERTERTLLPSDGV